ncbi:flavin reductase family protein [Streptomyces sp. NBC_00134]|uniref:flavin reductase family protein n=1 Tax=Streptomyces sp. NBC_00134 TaxID=2975663 RepID=UPI00387032A2
MGEAAIGSTGTAETFVDNGDLTADVLRGAYGRFPSGVTAVCGLVDGLPTGIAASSFTSVSLEPPLVSLCVARTSTTWPVLRRAACLGVSVLAEDQGPVARALASKTSDRFASVGWVAEPPGSVFVVGAALWLECRIVQEVPRRGSCHRAPRGRPARTARRGCPGGLSRQHLPVPGKELTCMSMRVTTMSGSPNPTT